MASLCTVLDEFLVGTTPFAVENNTDIFECKYETAAFANAWTNRDTSSSRESPTGYASFKVSLSYDLPSNNPPRSNRFAE